MRKRDEQLALYIGTNCPLVEMYSSSGKKRKILAGNMKDIFRIIQSIPSPKAEPFKLGLVDGFTDAKQLCTKTCENNSYFLARRY